MCTVSVILNSEKLQNNKFKVSTDFPAPPPALGFEIRASHFQGPLTTLATPPALFCDFFFEIGSQELFA
jgi:hypothetical protein